MDKTYHIIAFPHGRRTRVAVVYTNDARDAVKQATKQARVRDEYVDVVEVGRGVIATVDADGPV